MIQPCGTEMDINKFLENVGSVELYLLACGLSIFYYFTHNMPQSPTFLHCLSLLTWFLILLVTLCHISSTSIPLIQRIHQPRGCRSLTITVIQGEWFQIKFKYASSPEATPVMQGKEGSDDQTTKEKDQIGHSQKLYRHQAQRKKELWIVAKLFSRRGF